MGVIILNGDGLNSTIDKKNREFVKIDNKYYINLKDFEDSDSAVELSLSLASEVDSLRERVKVLEEKLKLYNNYDF